MGETDLLVWLVPLLTLVAGGLRPGLGPLVLVGALPYFGSPPGGPYLAALDVAALIALVTSLRAKGARSSRLDRPVALFVVVSLASLLPLAYWPPAVDPGTLGRLLAGFPYVPSWTILYSWRAGANLLIGWAIYLAIRRTLDQRSLWKVGAALAVGLSPVLVLALAEVVGLVDLWAWRPIGRELYDARVHSLFFHSGWLGEFLIWGGPLATAGLLAGPRRWRRLALPFAGLVIAVVLLSLQRAAWGCLVLQLGVLASMRRISSVPRLSRTELAASAAALVATIGLTLVVNPAPVREVKTRMTEHDLWPRQRIEVWETSLSMAADRPLLGWGVGAFSPVFDRRSSPGDGRHQAKWLTAHNFYAMVLAERGVLGLAALALVGLVAGRGLVEHRRRSGGGTVASEALVLCLVGVAAYGLFQYPFFVKAIEWLCWTLLGCVAVLMPKRSSDGPSRAALGIGLAALVAVALRLGLADPAPPRGSRELGLHAPEPSAAGPFRWTQGSSVQRLERQGQTLVLELANGHPRPDRHPVSVRVLVDGDEVGVETIRGGWRTLRLDLAGDTGEHVALTIDAAPTFRPYRATAAAENRSRDIRLLGVAMKEPQWE